MRRWILWVVCGSGLAGLLLLSLPGREVLDVYQTAPPAWSLRMTHPDLLRQGEAGQLTLEVSPPQANDVAVEILYARLDLGNLVQGNGEAGAVLQPGGSATFTWVLGGADTGEYAGRLWLYAGDPPVLLNARAVKIEVIGPPPAILWGARLSLVGLIGACVWAALRAGARPKKLK